MDTLVVQVGSFNVCCIVLYKYGYGNFSCYSFAQLSSEMLMSFYGNSICLPYLKHLNASTIVVIYISIHPVSSNADTFLLRRFRGCAHEDKQGEQPPTQLPYCNDSNEEPTSVWYPQRFYMVLRCIWLKSKRNAHRSRPWLTGPPMNSSWVHT